MMHPKYSKKFCISFFSFRLEAHSDVKDVLSDPNWIPILDEFQRDPQRAMIKYKDNAKVKKTLLRLCDVLGKSITKNAWDFLQLF